MDDREKLFYKTLIESWKDGYNDIGAGGYEIDAL